MGEIAMSRGRWGRRARDDAQKDVMAYFLIDTDAVIDYLRGIHDSIAMLKSVHDREDELCVCGVVVAEVFADIRPPGRGDVLSFISTFHFLPTPADAARLAGEWWYQHPRSARTHSTTDMLVAATAVFHRASLVTGNWTIIRSRGSRSSRSPMLPGHRRRRREAGSAPQATFKLLHGLALCRP
jgi:predicted nucleic acid-binding protein